MREETKRERRSWAFSEDGLETKSNEISRDES